MDRPSTVTCSSVISTAVALFTARCTLVQSAVLRLHNMSSVHPSLRLYVTLVDCDHKLEIMETNCTDNWPNTFALRSRKAIHSKGTWGNFGETRGGVRKSGNISEMREDRGKVTMDGL